MTRPRSPMLPWALVAALARLSFSTAVSPVAEVIDLLEDLEVKVTTDGNAEAATYDKFACFCRDTTTSKSGSITSSRDTINTKSSTIESKTATKEAKIEELNGLQKDHESYVRDLADLTARHDKETAEYQAKEADLSNALRSLNSAMQAMEGSKPPPAFLAVDDKVQRSLALAGVMDLISEPKRQEISSLLQTTATVDPNDPVFKYHSQGIIDILKKLRTDFDDQKTTLVIEWGKTVTTFSASKSGLEGKISSAESQIDDLKNNVIPTLTGEIADARSDLVNTEASLKDDQVYLQDLTELCETRAQEWDQRSALRKDELEAIQKALAVLKDDVHGRDTEVNKRALLQSLPLATPKVGTVSLHSTGPSFLQEQLSSASHEEVSLSSKTNKIAALLRQEGTRLHSSLLTAAAAQVAPTPFGKVKDLIQKLIERLIEEAAAEASKKGFCDENLGKAEKDRDYRLSDAKDLNQELKQLELKEDELQAEIAMLNEAIKKLKETLRIATEQRDADHNVNIHTISEAKFGLDGVKRAIVILKVFYKNAGKASVFQQISPVDEDLDAQNARAGFSGAYQGDQDSSTAIIGLLEVIESDFDRTIRKTTEAEAAAHAEFVLFERASKADISGKEEKRSLDQEDLITTQDTITEKMQALKKTQELLDSALKELEVLKPTCIDTTMKYSERMQKRQDEIDALKRAVCILDTDGVESGCEQ